MEQARIIISQSVAINKICAARDSIFGSSAAAAAKMCVEMFIGVTKNEHLAHMYKDARSVDSESVLIRRCEKD